MLRRLLLLGVLLLLLPAAVVRADAAYPSIPPFTPTEEAAAMPAAIIPGDEDAVVIVNPDPGNADTAVIVSITALSDSRGPVLVDTTTLSNGEVEVDLSNGTPGETAEVCSGGVCEQLTFDSSGHATALFNPR